MWRRMAAGGSVAAEGTKSAWSVKPSSVSSWTTEGSGAAVPRTHPKRAPISAIPRNRIQPIEVIVPLPDEARGEVVILGQTAVVRRMGHASSGLVESLVGVPVLVELARAAHHEQVAAAPDPGEDAVDGAALHIEGLRHDEQLQMI